MQGAAQARRPRRLTGTKEATMQAATYHLSISAARADALFVSALQRSDEPSAEQVRQAIAAAVRAFGVRGCAARVAQVYGERPETAVWRMRWARTTVTGVFGGARSEPVHLAVPAQRATPLALSAA
jgi:hypothetical protein